MKFPVSTILLIILVATGHIFAQKRTAPVKPKTAATKSAEVGQTAVVIDETLSILRKTPSLFSDVVHRMQRGRKVQILGV
ncbi:MAG: hypothetical protein WBB81_09310, partial [Pyrinomonadaceae bacterium]